MSKAETTYDVEHGVAVDPHRPTSTEAMVDVFVVVDDAGNEVARAYDPEVVAVLVAALTVVQRKPMGTDRPPVLGKPVRCPSCLGTESRVADSRAEDTGVMRRRVCLACGARYKTVEQVVALTTPGKPLGNAR